MAKKISELTSAPGTLDGTETLPLVQSGATYSASVSEVVATHRYFACLYRDTTAANNINLGNGATIPFESEVTEGLTVTSHQTITLPTNQAFYLFTSLRVGLNNTASGQYTSLGFYNVTDAAWIPSQGMVTNLSTSPSSATCFPIATILKTVTQIDIELRVTGGSTTIKDLHPVGCWMQVHSI